MAFEGHQVIDFGAHLHPTDPAHFEFIHDFIDDGVGDRISRDPDALAAAYEGSAVDRIALSQPYYFGLGDPEAVAAANDSLLSVIESREKFLGLAAIPTAAGGERAAEEFERCLRAGYNGGAVETRSEEVELASAELEPVFEVAADRGAPILVHPKLDDSLHPDVLDDRWRLNAIFGREVALAASLCKLIHLGRFDDYPGLDLVFHHAGGNVAAVLPRIELQLDEGRWPGLEDVVSYDEFKRCLEERVYLDTSGYFGAPGPISTTLSELPSTQLLFGTDFPYETRTTEEIDAIVEGVTASTSRTDAVDVLGGNARSLLANV